ncbi:SMODS domain-containing nucleotidyltransferase [Guyparkeria sp. TX1]|uniref:SMODS domain-containing nucleotidyltransferase n=1 Tax=Guyparkeria sp. TX1 TaxID=3115001 RepID=UPI003977D092
MTVNSHLVNLASDLVLSSTEKTNITTSINTLSSRLEAYFGVGINEKFQFGSSCRGTILPRRADKKSDIDYMVIFDTSAGQKKPQTYLDRLRRFAENKYSRSEISQSSPTIVLSLNHIRFELVPAVYSYGYLIPSPRSSWEEWMSTDPISSNRDISDKNTAENNKIKPLVRLVKYWNSTQGYPFASYDLEKYIVNQSYWFCASLKDYFYAFWQGFGCTYDTPQYIKDKVERAKSYAAKAKQYETDNMPASAEVEIKKIVPVL